MRTWMRLTSRRLTLRYAAGLSILIAGASSLAVPLAAQEKGEKVVVAKGEAALDVPGRGSVALDPGAILEVRGARGEWLRVIEEGEKDSDWGWVAKEAVIPLDEAEAHFTAKINDSSASVADFQALAQLRGETKGWEEAVAVYDAALKTFPESGLIYFHRGMAHSDLGKTKEAIADYEKAISLDATLSGALNNLAWIRATGADEFRDGKTALELATKARELTKDQDGSVLDTFAAASAEAGKFTDALRAEIAAIRLTERGPEQDALYERLKLYTAKQPYRAKSK